MKLGFIDADFVARFQAVAVQQVRDLKIAGVLKRSGAETLAGFCRDNWLGDAVVRRGRRMREAIKLARRTCCHVALLCSAGFFYALIPGLVCAQKLEQPARSFEAGDKVIYNWVLNNKSQLVEEEWATVTNGEAQGVQRVGGKELKVVLAVPSLVVHEAMCISNGQQCVYSPGIETARFPLEKGEKWTFDYSTKGETFTAQGDQQRRVEAVEKVKVPAGEFEAYKVSYEGRFRGTNTKGSPFSGRFEGSDWLALISGKLVPVKRVFRSSLGDKATLELVSTSFK